MESAKLVPGGRRIQVVGICAGAGAGACAVARPGPGFEPFFRPCRVAAMLKYIVSAFAVAVLSVGLVALADTVILKDGTRIQAASVMKMGDQYRVKTRDGQWRTIPAIQVKEIIKGSAAPGAGAG